MLVAVLAGDGVGPEVTAEAVRVLDAVGAGVAFESASVGGAAYKQFGHPLPEATLDLARRADAILFGAVGDPDCDALAPEFRPERAILALRKELGLFANLRPAKSDAFDLLIVRELTGDVYFGEKARETTAEGLRRGRDLMSYDEREVARIARMGFEAARGRAGRLCSVDKANVLETSRLWREVVSEVAPDYPDVALEHLYVDNAAMQLASRPERFDVILTGNLFGDILSDLASAMTGSIGLAPSASLDGAGKGLYEPIHGSAPDIAGQGKANPIGAILSAAMMLRHSFGQDERAGRIERAVAQALAGGAATPDLGGTLTTRAMGDAVIGALT